MSQQSYLAAIERLQHYHKFGIKLGLEQTRELARRSGNYEHGLKIIHIAGSNGKGSVAAMLECALRKCNFHTGLYTSPHLVSPRERFRVDGIAISEEDFARIFWRLDEIARTMQRESGASVTYFEITTIMALEFFRLRQVDFVILECGMGGRFDATNIIDPICSIITGIAFDHEKYLGDTLGKIAFEKAGIIKRERPVFVGKMSDEPFEVIRRRAKEENAELIRGDFDTEIRDFDCFCRGNRIIQCFRFGEFMINLSLPGEMQLINFRLVFAVLKFLATKYDFSLAEALSGLSEVRWPARIQILSDGTIIDGGHNPDGLQAMSNSLQKLFPGEKMCVIFGAFADKDATDGLTALLPLSGQFIFTGMKCSFRPYWSSDDLGKFVSAKGFENYCSAADETTALELARRSGRRILICGSLYLAGEFLNLLLDESEVLNLA